MLLYFISTTCLQNIFEIFLNPVCADLSLFPDAPANSKTVLFADFEMAGVLDAAESEALAKAISDVIEDFFQEAQVDSW